MWVYNRSSKKFILIVLYVWNNDLMVVANDDLIFRFIHGKTHELEFGRP